MIKTVLRDCARRLPTPLKSRLHRLRALFGSGGDYSSNYRALSRGAAPRSLRSWSSVGVAEGQNSAFRGVLESDDERADFEALRAAFQFIHAQGDLRDATVLEVGSGGCWNNQILRGFDDLPPLRYLGLDVSLPMLELARQSYPEIELLVGDAQLLPLCDDSVDVVLSGTSLMHIPDWKRAVAQSCRVARQFCVFHTVPIATNAPTTSFEKDAYGAPVWEWCFNESELLEVFALHGLEICAHFPSLEYDVATVVGEPTTTATWVCRVLPR